MPKPAYRRAAATSGGRNRRLFALGAVVAALGAAVGFTTISNAATNAPPGSDAGKVVNGQVILTDTCVDSKLPAHDGFQKGNRCVSTEFGEVGVAANNPSLLITQAPRVVAPNTPFTLKVSTRNLIRDRFLAAGLGGYYVESSVLKNGLVRGHFHTACRMLTSTSVAPAPDPVPAFFVATEDSKGGAQPDVVTIAVPGLPTAGTAQCASWAGDGSHRIPMTERANQTPAIDAVRITVTGRPPAAGNTGGQQAPAGAGGNAGKNGGKKGGATAAPTTAPSATATTTAPTTKDALVANATKAVTPATTTKPATTSGTVAKAATTGTSGTESTTAGSTGTESTTENSVKAATSGSTAADFVYSNEDGQLNSGNKATVAKQVADVQASAAKKQGGPLALTGTNTIAFIGGAAVLLLIGMIIMAFTRRRPRGTSWQ